MLYVDSFGMDNRIGVDVGLFRGYSNNPGQGLGRDKGHIFLDASRIRMNRWQGQWNAKTCPAVLIEDLGILPVLFSRCLCCSGEGAPPGRPQADIYEWQWCGCNRCHGRFLTCLELLWQSALECGLVFPVRSWKMPSWPEARSILKMVQDIWSRQLLTNG